MVNHKPLDKIIFDVESILPDIQRLSNSQNDLGDVSSFSLVDLSVYQMNLLELLETKSLNRSNQIQNLQMDGTVSEEEGTQALASKCPRLSL